MNIILEKDERTPMAIEAASTNGKLVKQGASQEISIFSLNPDLRLAMQYQIHPKFFLNAGARIEAQAFTRTKTTGDTYAAGSKVSNTSYETIAKTFGATRNQLTLGATLNATDNMFIEAVCGATSSSAGIENNRINVFSDGNDGPLNFGSILVGFRF